MSMAAISFNNAEHLNKYIIPIRQKHPPPASAVKSGETWSSGLKENV